MTHIHKNASPTAMECRKCKRISFSRNKLRRHLKENPHFQSWNALDSGEEVVPTMLNSERLMPNHRAGDEPEFRIKGMADTPDDDVAEENADHAPCAVCMRNSNSKKAFFQHLHLWISLAEAKMRSKRRLENNLNIEDSRR